MKQELRLEGGWRHPCELETAASAEGGRTHVLAAASLQICMQPVLWKLHCLLVE